MVSIELARENDEAVTIAAEAMTRNHGSVQDAIKEVEGYLDDYDRECALVLLYDFIGRGDNLRLFRSN